MLISDGGMILFVCLDILDMGIPAAHNRDFRIRDGWKCLPNFLQEV